MSRANPVLWQSEEWFGAVLCLFVVALCSCASVGPRLHQTAVVGDDDTLLDLARSYGLGYGEIVAANPDTDPWVPPIGSEVVLPTVHLEPTGLAEGIVVNLATQRLWFFEPGSDWSDSYPIGIGRPGWRTPLGTTQIVSKREAPTWHPPASARREDPSLPTVVGPGPDNPLGSHALYLGWPRYLIHGTNEPFGVGRRVSRGCIRLYPEHIVELYARAQIGSKVRVVNEPVLYGWQDGELFMEVHSPISQSAESLAAPLALGPELVARIEQEAGDQLERIDWTAVEVALSQQSGVPLRMTQAKPSFIHRLLHR